MTVSTSSIISGPYAGNDIASTFSYTFRIELDSQVEVYEKVGAADPVLLTLTTHYTVAGVGDDSGGIITRVAGALPSGSTWYIRANYAETQGVAFSSQGGFFPNIHEDVVDKLTFLTQQLQDKSDRSIKISDGDSEGGDLTLPDATARANRTVLFDENGDLIVGVHAAADLPIILAADAMKKLRVNEVADAIEYSFEENLNLAVTTGTYVLTRAQFLSESMDITGALTGSVTIEIPDNIPHQFIVHNETTNAFTVTVKHNATAGISVPQGGIYLLYTQGTVVEAGGGGSSASDIVFSPVTGLSSSNVQALGEELNRQGRQNLMPANFAGVWSESEDLYDVTTDAAPVVVGANAALDAGGSEVSNGGFDSATTDWTARGTGSPSIASVAGGATGNCLEVTSDGALDQGEQIVTVEVGKMYEFSIRNKHGTSTTGSIYLGTSRVGGEYYTITGLTNGSWAQYTGVFIATTTSCYINLAANGAGTELFDTVTLNEVTPGNVTGTSAPDGLSKHSGCSLFREYNGANTKAGEFYALKAVRASAGDMDYYPDTTGGVHDNPIFYSHFAGRSVVAGRWIKSSVAVVLRLVDSDGVSSSQAHTGGGTYEWLEVTRDIDSAITYFYVVLNAPSAATVYSSQPELAFGSSIGEGNRIRPDNSQLYLDTNVPYSSYTGATISADDTPSMQAESLGKLPIGVKAALVYLEGECATVEKILYVSDGGTIFPVKLWSQISNGRISAQGWAKCDANGDLGILRDDTFNNVTVQIHGVELW